MPLVTSNQYDLVPQFSNAGKGFTQGMQIGNQFRANRLQDEQLATEKAKQGRINQFTPAALEGDQEALSAIAQDDPKRALDIQKLFQGQSDAEITEGLRENKVLTQAALDAQSLPPEKRRAYLMQKQQEWKAAGRDTSNIDRALSGDDVAMNQAIELQARQGLAIDDQAKALFPSAGNGDPANVREYKFFQSLSADQKDQFLTMKRADPMFKMGDVTMQGSQLNKTATAVTESGEGSQADVQKPLQSSRPPNQRQPMQPKRLSRNQQKPLNESRLLSKASPIMTRLSGLLTQGQKLA